ncbi:MAG: hypothetical protein IJW47_01890 [Clostridia bacterium]|nr:hypothetical protein [Clostridia bacterium]
MRIKPALIIDAFFTAFISFILSFIVLIYFIPRTFAITFAVVLALLFTLLMIKRSLDKQDKIRLSAQQKKECGSALTALKLCNLEEQCTAFEKALKNNGYQTERKKGGVIIKDKSSVIFPLFSFDQLTKTDIVRVFNSVKSTDIAYILCDGCPTEIKVFADRFDGRIKIYGGDYAYKFLSENNGLPTVKVVLTERKPLNLSAFKNLFQKKKAKTLLGFGVIFLLMIYFFPIKTY